MSHIHIPDGVLPLWLWAAGWVITLIMIGVTGRMAAGSEARRKVPVLGVVAALMIVSMSSEIVPIAYHINLSVLAGILLGPALSVIAAFIVGIVLAMLGHGGVTVLGLNTMVISAEMILGWVLFRMLLTLLPRMRPALGAGLTTVVTLALSTTLVVGIVWLAGTGDATERKVGALDPATLRFENPFAEGVFKLELFEGIGGEEGHEDEPADEHAGEYAPGLSVGRFALVVYTLGPIGWLIEALITAGMIGYVARVRPRMVLEGVLAEGAPRIPGNGTGGH